MAPARARARFVLCQRGAIGLRRVRCGNGLEGTDRLPASRRAAHRSGRALRADGKTPLADALVFAYHTDRQGLYNPNQATHSWRLRGAVRTAADGSFEFKTIRPASYPQTRIPQHIHVELQTADGNFHAGEWRFADDPLLEASERAESERAGTLDGCVR